MTKTNNAYAQRKAWLRTLKTGDEIAIPRTTTGTDREHDLAKVVRITPTQLIAQHSRLADTEVRIRRTDGDVVGNRLLFIRQPGTVRLGA